MSKTESVTAVVSSECVIPPELRNSNWFKWGQEAGKKRTPLKKTIIKNLRFGCRQYDEFLTGYDNPKA